LSDEFVGFIVFIGMDQKLVLCFLHGKEIEDDNEKNLICDISQY